METTLEKIRALQTMLAEDGYGAENIVMQKAKDIEQDESSKVTSHIKSYDVTDYGVTGYDITGSGATGSHNCSSCKMYDDNNKRHGKTINRCCPNCSSVLPEVRAIVPNSKHSVINIKDVLTKKAQYPVRLICQGDLFSNMEMQEALVGHTIGIEAIDFSIGSIRCINKTTNTAFELYYDKVTGILNGYWSFEALTSQ